MLRVVEWGIKLLWLRTTGIATKTCANPEDGSILWEAGVQLDCFSH